MNKIFGAAIVAAMVSTQAMAGGFSTPIDEPELVDVTPQESSTGGLIVPLVFLGLVAVAIAADD